MRPKSPYFCYGEKELSHLRSRDRRLAEAIDVIGFIKRPVTPDLFAALVNAIIGQQISTKAHLTIWNRFTDTFSLVTPEVIALTPDQSLQKLGLSFRKVSYIKQAADRVLSGELDLSVLNDASDKEVCKRLSQLPGVGTWTAEMLMTFSLQRPNIMSYSDLAIQRGLRMLYHHRAITPQLFAKYQRRYSPYCSVASLYLWAIAAGKVPGLYDRAPKGNPIKRPKPSKPGSTIG